MKKNFWLLILILIISFVLHLLAIGKIPPGVTNDEAVDGYDAYSILKTGRDQWSESFPLEFKSFGDYKLPLFIYSLAPSIYFFGLNVFSLRFTVAIFAVFFVFAFYLLAKKLFKEKVALIASFLLALSPWFFSLSRVAHEGTLQGFLVILGVYFFINALEKEKFYLPSFTLFVLAFYTYHPARLFVPIFLFILVLFLREKIIKQKKWLLISLLITLIFCLPIIKSFIAGKGGVRLMQTNITRDIGVVNVLNDKRGACLKNFPYLVCRLVYNKPVVFVQKFAGNYLNHFSFHFLFLKGNAWGLMGEGKYFHLIFLPFLLIGFFSLFQKKGLPCLILFAWLMVAPLADSLTSEGHYGRAFLMVAPLCIIAAFGFCSFVNNIKNNFYLKVLTTILVFVLLFEVSNFFLDYFFYFPKYYSFYTHYEYQPLFEYLKTIEKDYDQIYLSRRYHDTKQYAFYLFYNQYEPKEFQTGKDVDIEIEKDGWIWVKRIGKWHFVASIPALEEIPGNSLLIGAPEEKIEELITPKEQEDVKNETVVQHLKTIYFLNSDPAFLVLKVNKS